jgi:hypothetical protein
MFVTFEWRHLDRRAPSPRGAESTVRVAALEQFPMRWHRVGSLHCRAHREKLLSFIELEQLYRDEIALGDRV